MKIGVDYYPEKQDKQIWSHDAGLMAENGVKIVRIGGIVWSEYEHSDSEYSFGWLDELITVFADFGIETVLCIPVEKPPLWFFQEYPDTVRSDIDGNLRQFCVLDRCCVNALKYREYAVRLTLNLVRRFRDNKNIVAWQIGNDIKAYPCGCNNCREMFRSWLLNKYDGFENISETFWQTINISEYSHISQVQPPSLYPEERRSPALSMEYSRFVSESANAFASLIALSIKRELPNACVTVSTALQGDTPNLYNLYDYMDFASFDNFPSFNADEKGIVKESLSFSLDAVRGLKQKKFWVMERIGGHTKYPKAVRPDAIKGFSLQAIAHGADTIIHSAWRAPHSGVDTAVQGILEHDSVQGRKLTELSELCEAVSKLSVIDTTTIVSDIAIICSPECDMALNILPQSENYSYFGQLKSFHAAFTHYGANVDIVSPTDDLKNYKVVVAPSLFIRNKRTSENIFRYVLNGGTLIMTNRSGVRDEYNNCLTDIIPNEYRELIGADITECDALGRRKNVITDFSGNTFECGQWCDIMKLTTAKAYAEYKNDFYASTPAVTLNRYCGGIAYYVGTVCEQAFYDSFAGNIMMQTGIPKLIGLPEGIEVTTRTNGLDEFIFFFNNSLNYVTFPLPKPMYSLFDSAEIENIKLKPFAVGIVRK